MQSYTRWTTNVLASPPSQSDFKGLECNFKIMPVECARTNENGTKTTQGVALWETQTERGWGGGCEGEKTDQLQSTPSR